MKIFEFTLRPYCEDKTIRFQAKDAKQAVRKLNKYLDVAGIKEKYYPTYFVEIKDEDKNRRTTK